MEKSVLKKLSQSYHIYGKWNLNTALTKSIYRKRGASKTTAFTAVKMAGMPYTISYHRRAMPTRILSVMLVSWIAVRYTTISAICIILIYTAPRPRSYC
jgi:hypothetical protein